MKLVRPSPTNPALSSLSLPHSPQQAERLKRSEARSALPHQPRLSDHPAVVIATWALNEKGWFELVEFLLVGGLGR